MPRRHPIPRAHSADNFLRYKPRVKYELDFLVYLLLICQNLFQHHTGMRQVLSFEQNQKEIHEELPREIYPFSSQMLNFLSFVGFLITEKTLYQPFHHVTQHLGLLFV